MEASQLVSAVQELGEFGCASVALPASFEQVHGRAFAAAQVGLDMCETQHTTHAAAIPADADSASASGLHAVGALSAYNQCREGFVFSNGDMFGLGLDGHGLCDREDSFSQAMSTLFASTCSLARTVLSALEMELGVEQGWFVRTLGPLEKHSQWHMKRYRAEAASASALTSDGRRVLLPMHSDPSLFSIVIHDRPGSQEGAQGLEVLHTSGQWAEVARSGHAVATVLVGSVLDRLTTSHFPAARHRVALPDASLQERRVVATFFFRPAPSALLTAPPSHVLAHLKAPKPIRFKAWNERVARNYERHALRSKDKKDKKDKKERGETDAAANVNANAKGTAKGTVKEERKRRHREEQQRSRMTPGPPDEPFIAPCGSWLQLLGGNVAGQEKYLGGSLGSDNKIYAIPGHARRVLCIDPATGTVDQIGPEFEGQYKWLRSVDAVDGKGQRAIYGLPCHANSVLKIVPATGEVTTIGDVGDGLWKWHGGVLANGYIYGIPQFATAVLRIEVATDKVDTIGGPFEGRNKWYGGLLGEIDGAIYGVPQCATSVLRIDPVSQEVTTIGNLPSGGWKWHGGVVGCDGAIYSLPAHADSVLRIIPGVGADARVEEIGAGQFITGRHRTDGKYKFLGGVMGLDGCIYGVPSDSDRVLKIDPRTSNVSEVGPSLHEEKIVQNKWQNGFLAKDGTIYGIPLKAETVLCIRPHVLDAQGEPEVTTIGGPFTGLNKWEGGVMGADGAMYCMPLNHKRVLRIGPKDMPPPSVVVPPPPIAHTRDVQSVAVLRSSGHSASYSKGRKKQAPPKGEPLPPALRQQAVMAYNAAAFDLPGHVAALLRAGGAVLGNFTDDDSGLEGYAVSSAAVSKDSPRWTEAQQTLTGLVAKGVDFLDAVERLVREAVIPDLKRRLRSADPEGFAAKTDEQGRLTFLVQHPPTVRVQPGNSDRTVRMHHDAEYGHQAGELNYWLPLTDPALTETTLWVESEPYAGDFRPLAVRIGEAASFHGSLCRHFVPANTSAHTRVSIDFRVGVVGHYDSQWCMQGTIADHSRIRIVQ